MVWLLSLISLRNNLEFTFTDKKKWSLNYIFRISLECCVAGWFWGSCGWCRTAAAAAAATTGAWRCTARVVGAVGQVLGRWIPDACVWATAGCTWFPAAWIVWRWCSCGRIHTGSCSGWLLHQIVCNKTDHQCQSQFRNEQCFDRFDSNDAHENWQNCFQFQFQEQKSWQQKLLLDVIVFVLTSCRIIREWKIQFFFSNQIARIFFIFLFKILN